MSNKLNRKIYILNIRYLSVLDIKIFDISKLKIKFKFRILGGFSQMEGKYND